MPRLYQGAKRKLLLSIHKGFSTMPALISTMHGRLCLPLQSFAVVRFLNAHYGVAFGGLNREMVVGEDVVWYRKDWIMRGVRTNEFQLPYEITGLAERRGWMPGVWHDMRAIDPHLAVFRFGRRTTKNTPKDITACEYSRTYVILLGLTFYDDFWSRERLSDLDDYFADSHYYGQLFRDPNIRGINPFRSRVLLRNGAIRTHPFY